MNKFAVDFSLSFSGADSEEHEIDLYDVSQALIGFQRSLALTTHLILNDTIITQAPSLKGAQIFALPAEEGSWKISAGILILGTASYHVTTAPKDTPLGHIIYSAYDYVVSESLGVHVDYDKSLGQLYEETKRKNIKLPVVREAQLDSLIEKCGTAIKEIHRPIYKTKTATQANITSNIGNTRKLPLGPTFSIESFEYLVEEYLEEEIDIISGYVSSYNSNTYKGRIFVPDEERPVSFELSKMCRDERSLRFIVNSLSENALRNFDNDSRLIYCRIKRNKSKSGHLKSYVIISVSNVPFPPSY